MNWITTSTILRDLGGEDSGSADRAWTLLADRFRRPVVHVLRRMGLTDEDADDAAQDSLVALLSAVRGGKYDRSRARLSNYLFGIVYRTGRAARRGANRRGVTERPVGGASYWGEVEDERIEGAASTGDGGVRAHERLWEAALLAAAMESVRREVDPATWEAFDLVVNRGVPSAEVAARLGIAMTTVYNAKHRVLRRLRARRAGMERLERTDGPD